MSHEEKEIRPDSEESTKVVEIIVIIVEEHVRHKKPFPPHQPHHVYKFRVNKELYESKNPILSGSQILEIASKIPVAEYKLDQVFPDRKPEKLGLDEKVDLTTHGIERFVAVPIKNDEG